jgi:hypothetical protein
MVNFGYTVVTGKIDPAAVDKSLSDFSVACASRMNIGWIPTGGITAGKLRVYQAFSRNDMIPAYHGGTRRRKHRTRSTRKN